MKSGETPAVRPGRASPGFERIVDFYTLPFEGIYPPPIRSM
jgi:hypothetical protein